MNRVKILLMAGLAAAAFSGIGCNGDNPSERRVVDNDGTDPETSPTAKTYTVDWSAATEINSPLNKKSAQNDGAKPPQTNGTQWKLVGVGGMHSNELRELEPKDCAGCYTLEIDTSNLFIGLSSTLDRVDGTLRVSSPSNNLGLIYKIDDENNTIKIGECWMTKVGSVNEDNEMFERAFFEHQIYSVNLTGNELRLFILTDSYFVFRLQTAGTDGKTAQGTGADVLPGYEGPYFCDTPGSCPDDVTPPLGCPGSDAEATRHCIKGGDTAYIPGKEPEGEVTGYPVRLYGYDLLTPPCRLITAVYRDKRDTEITVINSVGELREYIACDADKYLDIDFSNNSILLALGWTPSEISYKNVTFQQTSADKYVLNVVVQLSGLTRPDAWSVAYVTNKLRTNADLILGVINLEPTWGTEPGVNPPEEPKKPKEPKEPDEQDPVLPEPPKDNALFGKWKLVEVSITNQDIDSQPVEVIDYSAKNIVYAFDNANNLFVWGMTDSSFIFDDFKSGSHYYESYEPYAYTNCAPMTNCVPKPNLFVNVSRDELPRNEYFANLNGDTLTIVGNAYVGKVVGDGTVKAGIVNHYRWGKTFIRL